MEKGMTKDDAGRADVTALFFSGEAGQEVGPQRWEARADG
jgi:hypothetical protein